MSRERPSGPVALAFPGAFVRAAGPEQGLREAFPAAFGPVLAEASEVTGKDLLGVSVEDALGLQEGERQVFLQAFGIGMSVLVRQRGLAVAATLGHSLGLYGALVGAGALPVREGLQLVLEAWRLVREAYERDPAGMLGLVGLSEEEVLALPGMEEGRLVVVNAPVSHVVAGRPDLLERIRLSALAAGAMKVVLLDDRVAYHHPERLSEAAARLEAMARDLPWRDPEVPVVSPLDGTPVRRGSEALDLLRKNLCTPIRWPLAVSATKGAVGFVECGVGNSLAALARMLDDPRRWWGARHLEDLP